MPGVGAPFWGKWWLVTTADPWLLRAFALGLAFALIIILFLARATRTEGLKVTLQTFHSLATQSGQPLSD